MTKPPAKTGSATETSAKTVVMPTAWHEHLPHMLRELFEATTLEKVLAFAAARGGTRISVPRRIPDGHWIAETLGRAGADKLSAMYGGEIVLVPMGPSGTIAAARRKLAAAIEAGEPPERAAHAVGLHGRTGQRMKARLRGRGSSDQGELF